MPLAPNHTRRTALPPRGLTLPCNPFFSANARIRQGFGGRFCFGSRKRWPASRSLGEGWCQERESNPRPKAYESSALPLSYPGDCGDGNKPSTPGKIQPKLLRAIARAQFRIAGGPMWHGHPARVWRLANSSGRSIQPQMTPSDRSPGRESRCGIKFPWACTAASTSLRQGARRWNWSSPSAKCKV